MLLSLPMVGLGFLALSGGLRFTVYAVPILAIGVAFLIYEISQFLSTQFINDKVAAIMKIAYLNEIKKSNGSSNYHWEKTVAKYLSMFNYDIEFKRALEEIGKESYVEDMDEKTIVEDGYKAEGLQKTVMKVSKSI